MSEYREQLDADRAKGLEQRHRFRLEMAVRREVAEEIAAAIEKAGDERSKHRHHNRPSVSRLGDVRHASYLDAAKIAREIGARQRVCSCRTIAPSGWDRVQQVVDPDCIIHGSGASDGN